MREPLSLSLQAGRSLILGLLVLVFFTVGALSRPAQAAPGWPSWRFDVGGSGAVKLTVGGVVKKPKAWRFRGGSHVWGYQPGMSVWSSPAVGVVEGRAVVFVGSYDKNVYCLDALTGEKLWRYTTGGGIYATPALWQPAAKLKTPALLFVASSDRLVYALEAGLGRRRWVHQVESWRPTIGGARLSSPAIGEVAGKAAVFFGHWVWDKSLRGHLQKGGLTALDAQTGKKLWTADLGDNQLSSPVVLSAGVDPRGRPRGGLVFVASENGNLYAIEAESGTVRWASPQRNVIKASPALFSTPAGWRVVIGSKHGLVRCLDAETGKDIWRFKTGHWVDGSASIARLDGRPVVFVGSYDMRLYALDGLSGNELWSYRTAGGIYSSPAVVTRKGRTDVLISAWDHHLHVVAAADGALRFSTYTGRPLWDAITLGDSTWSSPVVAEINGHALVYFGSYAGPFHALVLDEAAKQALARPGSNIDFWVTLPLVVLGVTVLLVVLTRRERRRRGSGDRAPTL